MVHSESVRELKVTPANKRYKYRTVQVQLSSCKLQLGKHIHICSIWYILCAHPITASIGNITQPFPCIPRIERSSRKEWTARFEWPGWSDWREGFPERSSRIPGQTRSHGVSALLDGNPINLFITGSIHIHIFVFSFERHVERKHIMEHLNNLFLMFLKVQDYKS